MGLIDGQLERHIETINDNYSKIEYTLEKLHRHFVLDIPLNEGDIKEAWGDIADSAYNIVKNLSNHDDHIDNITLNDPFKDPGFKFAAIYALHKSMGGVIERLNKTNQDGNSVIEYQLNTIGDYAFMIDHELKGFGSYR